MFRYLIPATLLSMCVLPADTNAQECAGGERTAPISAWEGAFTPAGEFPDSALGTAQQSSLQDALATAQAATAAPSIGAAVLTQAGEWSSGDGSQVFFWASVGKMVTASIIFQLIDEGSLTLHTPISAFVDEVPRGDEITIEMLLGHTSGLGSANEIVQERGLPSPATLAEELALVSENGLLFCPGTGWRYSNTGYALLGAVIESLDGVDYAEAVDARLTRLLGLSTLRIVNDPQDAGFVALAPGGDQPTFHPSQAGAAGSVVATPRDMARFLAALMNGQIIPPESVSAMGKQAWPMFDPGTYYGLGAMAYRFPDSNGGNGMWIGHSGGVPGAKALIAYDQLSGNIAAVALTGNGSAEATANLLFRTISAAD